MHYGIILLVEAEEKDEARETAEEFLEENPIGDWWKIGGRCSGMLNPLDRSFRIEVEKIIPDETTETLEKSRPLLQAKWQEMGGSDLNPLNRDDHKDSGYDDDVMPLSEVISVVHVWRKRAIDEAAKYEEKARTEKRTDMRGFLLRIAGSLLSGTFCPQVRVHNITTGDCSIPDDLVGWFAVMVDLHY